MILDTDAWPADWPQGLKDVADAVGKEAALILADAIGGIPMYIRKEPTSTCALTKYIGLHCLQKLAAAYGGSWLTVPKYAISKTKKRIVLTLLEQGKSFRTVAAGADVTVRYVTLVAAERKNKQKQFTLPL